LAYLNPGDFFGEIGLFNEDANRTALVRARAESEIAQISYSKLRGLTELYPDLIIAMTSQIARRLRNTNRKLGDPAFMAVLRGRCSTCATNRTQCHTQMACKFV
jgi:CRP/FNR family cyclic AMP-dependent transcriptional regulator